VEIRLAQFSDLKEYRNHLLRHGKESGQDGDLIFAPYEQHWDQSLEDLKKEKTEKWSKPVTQARWERCWILVDKGAVYGEIKLAHHLAMKTTLHRAILMIGIEKPYRGQGLGNQLVQTALSWAKNQTTLD
jgi:GNAT superfamily N-acetyltransferase